MSITRAENIPQVLSPEGGSATMSFSTRSAMAAKAMSANAGINALADEGGTPPSGESNLKTPDYHLPFTGPEVEDALWKIIRLDLNEVGGVTIIESTPDAPANLDVIVEPGNYTLEYAQAATFPDELVGVTILNLGVFRQADGTLIQILEGAGQTWYRFSKDEGQTWSQFAIKSTNGPIDTSGDPTTPPGKDPITILEEHADEVDRKLQQIDQDLTDITEQINNMQTSITDSMLWLGSAEVGTQIVNGTFDYDTVLTRPTPTQPTESTTPGQ